MNKILLVAALVVNLCSCVKSRETCIARETRSCPCLSGAQGTQKCNDNGTWRTCLGCSETQDSRVDVPLDSGIDAALDIVSDSIDSADSWAPSVSWAQSAGGAKYDIGWDVATDSQGNVYVTGPFTYEAIFGGTILSASQTLASNRGIFVAKYDSNGNLHWAKSMGGHSWKDHGLGITTDSSNNVYVTGSFQGSNSIFGTTTFSSFGGSDIFAAKLDSSGNMIWVISAGGSYNNPGEVEEAGKDIAVDNSGNVYVAGYFMSSGIASPLSFGTHTLNRCSDDKRNIFVAKIEVNGATPSWKWAIGSKTLGPTVSQNIKHEASSIAIDANSNVYITGYFVENIFFGTTSLTSNISTQDLLIAKFDSNGNKLWSSAYGGTSNDSGIGISLDTTGNAYVTGVFKEKADFGSITLTSTKNSSLEYTNNVFVAKFDPITGTPLWAKSAGGISDSVGYAIASTPNGNTYVAGTFSFNTSPSSPIAFGSTTLSFAGSIFVANYDTNGTFLWATSTGGSLYCLPRSIALDQNSNGLYLTGHYSGSATFGIQPISSLGEEDIFVAKILAQP